MRRMLPGWWILALVVASPGFGRAACASEMCEAAQSASGRFRGPVEEFYRSRDYALAWTTEGTLTPQAGALLQALEHAEEKGLEPRDYDGPLWASRVARFGKKTASEKELARFDLALSSAVLRYVSDLRFGRRNPGRFGESRDNLASLVENGLLHATDVSAAIEEIEPPYEGYRRTRDALRRYIVLAREDQRQRLAAPRGVVKEGDSYADAGRLADLLRRLGDLPADASVEPQVYGAALAEAVRHFQERHGLEPDGELGPRTLARLNVPLRQRVRQLVLALERWRWVPRSLPRLPIIVNIPEFVLRAPNGSYLTGLEMKVVVGRAYHNPTPMFAASLSLVVVRPYWEVPWSIQWAELVPKLEKDRSYFEKNHFEVVTKQNTLVSKGAVDDALLARLRSGELRVRQAPGPANSLGLIKFLFPNQYNVYLHATPATELFSKTRRDFSHGCIRVEKPLELAEWVLRDHPEWTPQRITEAMQGEETIEIPLDRPIPVLIVYTTAVVLRDGKIRFLDDIYGQDARLERDLAGSR